MAYYCPRMRDRRSCACESCRRRDSSSARVLASCRALRSFDASKNIAISTCKAVAMSSKSDACILFVLMHRCRVCSETPISEASCRNPPALSRPKVLINSRFILFYLYRGKFAPNDFFLFFRLKNLVVLFFMPNFAS